MDAMFQYLNEDEERAYEIKWQKKGYFLIN